MKVHVLRKRQTIPLPIERVFAFFERPENLARITPPRLGFRILTPSPIRMKAGTLIDYTIRVLGIPVRWTTLITSYEPPGEFVDEQLRGPYTYWHHRHQFRAIDGGTEILDEVHYALPGGPLASLVHMLFVRRELERIFAHRSDVIARHFAGERAGVMV